MKFDVAYPVYLRKGVSRELIAKKLAAIEGFSVEITDDPLKLVVTEKFDSQTRAGLGALANRVGRHVGSDAALINVVIKPRE